MTELICYVGGQFVPKDKACLPLDDLGIVRGYGVFDFVRTYGGKLFRLREHVQRLETSAQILDITMPWTIEEIETIIQDTLRRNNLPEAGIRVLVTGGPSADSVTPLGQPRLIVLVSPPRIYPADRYEKGVKVITVSIARFAPEAKSLNYTSAVLASQQAKAAGAIEALYVNRQGQILEGTSTNFFILRGAQLVTPRDDMLKGITRDIVLQLAEEHFEIVERPVDPAEIPRADEAFICSSSKEIMPVIQINDMTVGNGEPGHNTRMLMKLFREYTNSDAWW